MSTLRRDDIDPLFFDCGFECGYRVTVCDECDEARKGLGIRSCIHQSSLGGVELLLSGGQPLGDNRLDRIGRDF